MIVDSAFATSTNTSLNKNKTIRIFSMGEAGSFTVTTSKWSNFFLSQSTLPIQANSINPCIKIRLDIDSYKNIVKTDSKLIQNSYIFTVLYYIWHNSCRYLPGESIMTTSSPSILHFSLGQTTRIFLLGSTCSLLRAFPNCEMD